ncbi:MAG: exo-alpha-sialidase, partial [Gammaproteobacteria bacterium]|nr:exo-alpha-sialidase [Gammaproteobacteria bacterium]
MGNNWSSPDTISQSLEDPGEGAYLSPNISNSEISSEVVQAAVPAVAPNGDVYVVWLYTAGSTGSPGEIRVRRSTDGGNTFGPTITADNITTAWKVFVGTGLRATSMPTVTIDPNSGNIYVAYIQYDSGDLNIYYVRSTDQGNSWDPPEIATESTANHQFFPWLTVSPFGTVSIVYYQGISTSVDVYIAESYDNGETFYVPNTKVTEVSSNPNNLANPGFTSDYIGIASTTGHNVYPAWADFRNNNADVYTALYNSAVKLAHEDKSFDNNATYSNSARHLAKSAGYLHEVFASGGEIFYRRSANTGLSWDVTERITTGNGDNLNACLTYTEDANYDPPTIIHAVWERNSGPNTYEVWYARSNAEVINWSEPVRLAILETSQWQSGAMPVITHGGDSDELMIVYASQEGLYYTHSADFGESWSTAQLIFSSPYVRYPTLSGSAEVVSLLYDLEDDKEGVFSRKYDGGSWSSPAWPADIAGTLNNRTPSVTFDAQGRPLAVWKGQIYEDELDPYSSIIFRQGLPDNTWDDWFVVFEHEPEESSLAPSVSYFDKNVDYGVEIVYHTSQDQVKNVVYNGSYWSMPDVNRPGRWANISEEAAGTGNPVFYWTTPDGPPFDIQLEGGTGESTQLARGTGGRENLTLTPRRRAVLRHRPTGSFLALNVAPLILE